MVSNTVNEYYGKEGDNVSEDSFGPEFETVDLNPYYGGRKEAEYDEGEVNLVTEEMNPYYDGKI